MPPDGSLAPAHPERSAALLVNIDVPDLAGGERFYAAAFGLAPGRRFGADAVEMLGWPAPVYLLRKRTRSVGASTDKRRYRRHWTPVHFDVVVGDLDAALSRAMRAGATVDKPPQTVPYGRLAMLADPFGHGFCLIEFNAAGYDALPR